MLKALERHIPAASLLLEGRSDAEWTDRRDPADLWKQLKSDSCDVFAVFGLSVSFYTLACSWLDGQETRRLIFIEEEEEALFRLLQDEDAIFLLNDLRVKIHFLESPLQIESVAKKVAWQAVFRSLEVVRLLGSVTGAQFEKEVKTSHRAAFLILSESSDWGGRCFKNARCNSQRQSRRGMALKGKFEGIPAIVLGAGPSLEKNGHLISSLEERALLFSGGSALNILDGEPHFAGAIDFDAPYHQFKMQKNRETPFCYQNRMSRDNFSLVHGEPILFPDGNLAAIDWLQNELEPFDAGWMVGNFFTQVALFLGCNPIIFVGMDLCYRKNQKYAHMETEIRGGLIEVEDREGQKVWTQSDWLMAAEWMEKLAARHPERLFINATEGGLHLKSPILSKSLQDLMATDLLKERDLRGKVHAEIQMLPFSPRFSRWEIWDASLKRCEGFVSDIGNFQRELMENEIVYEKLLAPLWQIWRPLFERELDLDPQPLALKEKMNLNEILFFQQVLREHIHGK